MRQKITCVIDDDIIAAVRHREPSSRRALYDISVVRALRRLGAEIEYVAACEPGTRTVQNLVRRRPELVFNLAYSGAPAEAGFVAILELLEIPFTGSDSLAIRLANDKFRSRLLLRSAGMRVPDFVLLQHGRASGRFAIAPPYIVKPIDLANSLGVRAGSIVKTRARAAALAEKIWREFRVPAVCDSFVVGREFQVGLVETRRAFERTAIVELHFAGAMPGYGFKSEAVTVGRTRHRVYEISVRPARLPAAILAEMTAIAKRAAALLNLRGYAKIDLRMDGQGRIFVIEANANPGLWSQSPIWRTPDFSTNISRILAAARRRAREQ